MHADESRLNESIGAAGDVSRRTINRGMAWSVPVIVGAFAAPAIAASGVNQSFSASAVGSSGRYAFSLNVKNSRKQDVAVELLTLTKSGSSASLITATSTTVRAGKSSTITVYTGAAAPGETYTLAFKVAGVPDQQSVTLT